MNLRSKPLNLLIIFVCSQYILSIKANEREIYPPLKELPSIRRNQPIPIKVIPFKDNGKKKNEDRKNSCKGNNCRNNLKKYNNRRNRYNRSPKRWIIDGNPYEIFD